MVSNNMRLLLTGSILGLIVGVLFIYIQPLFGMSPLTQRHAEGYMNLNEMSHNMAIFIAWCVHLFISVCYGIACSMAFLMSKSNVSYAAKIIFLSWITTVIAPPANAFLVKFIGTQSLSSFAGLPALNFGIDAKFMLHLLFFSVIAASIYLFRRKREITVSL